MSIPHLKNVRARSKLDCKVKDIKSMDAKEMKSKFLWKEVMDACDVIVESESKEA